MTIERADALELQLSRIGEILTDLAAEIDVATSRKRALPSTNLIGYTLWHIARTVDWSVNTMTRGTPEVAFDFDFQGVADAKVSQIGFGLQLHEADAIAEGTTPAEVAKYYGSVLTDAVEWLRTDPDLSAIPDVLGNQPDFPGYQTNFYLEEVRTFQGDTALQILVDPAIGHVRGHFGEIDLLKQMLG